MQSIPSDYPHLGLLRGFHFVQPRIVAKWNAALAPHQLQHHEWLALLLVSVYGQLLPSQLSDMLDLTRTSLTRLTDDLVQKGLLRRDINPKDRRQIALEMTIEGKKRFQAATVACQNVQQEMLSVFSATELAQFQAWQMRLLAHLNGENLALKKMQFNENQEEKCILNDETQIAWLLKKERRILPS